MRYELPSSLSHEYYTDGEFTLLYCDTTDLEPRDGKKTAETGGSNSTTQLTCQ